jgi:hypothetical protein
MEKVKVLMPELAWKEWDDNEKSVRMSVSRSHSEHYTWESEMLLPR